MTAASLEVLGPVDVPWPRAHDGHLERPELPEQLARTAIPFDAEQPVEHLGREGDGVARTVLVAGARRRDAVEDGARDVVHGVGSDVGFVGEEDDRDAGTTSHRGPDADPERAGLARLVVHVDGDLDGRGAPRGRRDVGPVVPDDDHHLVDEPSGGREGDHVPDERATAELRELLGRPEPRRGASRQDHGDHRPRRLTVTTSGGRREVGQRRTAAVVTASDGVASGHRQDGSGDAVAALLADHGWEVVRREVVPDVRPRISALLAALADEGGLAVVCITGGTGFGPRDVTPEATRDVCHRDAPGLAEAMRAAGRASTPMADLSRGVCAIRGATLLIDLPGSPRGATESLTAIIGLLPHAVDLLGGDTEHPSGAPTPADG